MSGSTEEIPEKSVPVDSGVHLAQVSGNIADSTIMTSRFICFAAFAAIAVAGSGIAFAQEVTSLAGLEAAAQGGDVKALTQLAIKYEHAEGVQKDFLRANHLYCQAARLGYAEAQFKLGWIYANGRGVPRDDGVAAALFIMAAEQGHEYAKRLLQYVRQQPNTELPACLLPDPVGTVRLAVEVEEEVVTGARGEIEQLVQRLAPQYSVDPRLVMALISVESAFNTSAVSPKNAQGLMQLIPETAERFGVKKVFNPVENLKGGMAYLQWLLAFFQGDVALVLAAYNAGERAVEKYRGIPPYPETRNYVRRITGMYKKALHPYQPEIVAPSPVLTIINKHTRG